MPFEDDLQLALDPTKQLPRELHLGRFAYSWTNGKLEYKGATPGFRKLRAEELRQLMRRLQAAPQHHVILLNLGGHDIGDDMMRELAEAIAALKALQVLILSCKSPPPLLPRVFVFWRQVHFHTVKGPISAPPPPGNAKKSLQLYRTCWRFMYWISQVIVFDILCSICSVTCKDLHTLQVTTFTTPDAQQLRELYRTCWRFKY